MRAVAIGCWLLGWTMLSSAMAGSDVGKRFRVDPAVSLVWFDADARLHTFRGQTRQIQGSFILTQTSPPRIAEAQLSIDAASIETGNAQRDTDMRQDFLEVATYPTIRFTVLELPMARPAADENVWDVVLRGRLTIHGVTRDVQVPTTVSLASQEITARGQLYLDMRDFKIRVPRLLLIPMQSEVLIGFEVFTRLEP